jgi:hypothetical protein
MVVKTTSDPRGGRHLRENIESKISTLPMLAHTPKKVLDAFRFPDVADKTLGVNMGGNLRPLVVYCYGSMPKLPYQARFLACMVGSSVSFLAKGEA